MERGAWSVERAFAAQMSESAYWKLGKARALLAFVLQGLISSPVAEGTGLEAAF